MDAARNIVSVKWSDRAALPGPDLFAPASPPRLIDHDPWNGTGKQVRRFNEPLATHMRDASARKHSFRSQPQSQTRALDAHASLDRGLLQFRKPSGAHDDEPVEVRQTSWQDLFPITGTPMAAHEGACSARVGC